MLGQARPSMSWTVTLELAVCQSIPDIGRIVPSDSTAHLKPSAYRARMSAFVELQSELALDTCVRGTVTDRFDRNRHVLRLNIGVTVACMNDLDPAARHLQELPPDVADELEH